METHLIMDNTRPKKAFHRIIQIGLRGLNLATAHQTAIEERLPEVVTTLTLKLDELGVAIPGVLLTRNESVAATSAQNARIRQGYARVRAIRRMIVKAKALPEVRKAYGVGRRLHPTVHASVTAALKMIVNRATDEPAEAAALGLGPVTVADLTAFLASLSDTSKTQETKRAAAPLSTKERNALGHSVLQTVALIAGAGMVIFADDPVLYASFDELLAGSKKAAKKTAAPEPSKTPPVVCPAPAVSPAPVVSPAPATGSTPDTSTAPATSTIPAGSPINETTSAPAESPVSSTPPASP
jgi:hypothetical protein